MYTFGKNHTEYNFTTKINKKFLIDFYIYTDNLNNYRNNFKSLNIIKVPILNKLDFIDENRLTAKYYKFKIIPDEMKNIFFHLLNQIKIKNYFYVLVGH